MHVFQYSPRKGTRAAVMPNQIDGNIKEERSRILVEAKKEADAIIRNAEERAKALVAQERRVINGIYHPQRKRRQNHFLQVQGLCRTGRLRQASVPVYHVESPGGSCPLQGGKGGRKGSSGVGARRKGRIRKGLAGRRACKATGDCKVQNGLCAFREKRMVSHLYRGRRTQAENHIVL